MSTYEPVDEPDFLEDDDEPTTEIVTWFDDTIWNAPFVPSAVAFGAGLLAGVLGTLLALRLAGED